MIRCTLPVLRAKRGRMTLRGLSEQTGLAVSTLSRLETGKTKGVEFGTMEALCQFFSVQPGDLFEYVPGDEQALASATPATVDA
jgi:putative transcriptional regulator